MKAPNNFTRFGLHKSLLSSPLLSGFEQVMPIQQRVLPKALEGRDVLARSDTGSGKTLAYVLPLLQSRIEQRLRETDNTANGHHVRALVLVPTRELALQVVDVITQASIAVKPNIKCLPAYGGVDIGPQRQLLKRGVEVLVATPQRVLDLLEAKALAFNKLKTLVLDEVDRLISPDFSSEVEQVIKLLPNARQNLFFTATFPESIRPLVRNVLDNPEIIDLEPARKVLIDQHIVSVNESEKAPILASLLRENDWKQVLIFCTSKRRCNKLAKEMAEQEVDVQLLHGDLPGKQREATLAGFRSGMLRVLIATDVAARGLDIGQLDCVINLELPRQVNDYQHRIGRTGRAGKVGQAITLLSHHEEPHFQAIEKFQRERMPREEMPGFPQSLEAPPPPRRRKPKKVLGKKRKAQQRKARAEKQKKRLLDNVEKSTSSYYKGPKTGE